MALQLTENFKGIECNYWKILESKQNYTNDTNRVLLGLYKDKAARDADVKAFLKTERMDIAWGEISREQQYEELKKSVPLIIKDESVEYDEDGNATTIPAETKETNKFVDAVDVI